MEEASAAAATISARISKWEHDDDDDDDLYIMMQCLSVCHEK